MWLKKENYDDLLAKVEKLSKENEKLAKANKDFISKYEGKINSELNLKEYKKELDRKSKEETEAYKKNLDAIVAKDFNYAFLQQLVNAAAKGTIIEVRLKEGNSIVIRKEVEDTQQERDFYNIL